jgi:hypothetical protein
MLAHYYNISPRSDILESARSFILCSENIPALKNKRGTSWAILDGYESFSSSLQIEVAMKSVISRFDVEHLPNYRHICTDLYRLCWAYDHAVKDFKHPILKVSVKRPEPIPSKVLKPFRRFGLHKVRHLKYLFR